MHELDTNVFVKNKYIRGKNIQFTTDSAIH